MAENETKDTTLKENEELNKYIAEFNDDVKLNLGNLREKSLMVSTIRAKWLAYLFKERENLSRIKDMKARILKQKVDASKNDSVLRLKTEESISNNDENIQKLNRLEKMTNANIDYIERNMNILNDFVWQLKNCLEILKLEKM